jgi:hypothetical protein
MPSVTDLHSSLLDCALTAVIPVYRLHSEVYVRFNRLVVNFLASTYTT